jgi:hypothetical protein
VQVAVVEHAPPRSHFKGALLLLFAALLKLLVAHNLQPEQPPANGQRPHQKEKADDPEARPLEGNDAGYAVRAAAGSNG